MARVPVPPEDVDLSITDPDYSDPGEDEESDYDTSSLTHHAVDEADDELARAAAHGVEPAEYVQGLLAGKTVTEILLDKKPDAPQPLARILLGDQVAAPPSPKTVKDYLREYKESLNFTGDIADLINSYNATEFFAELREVPAGERHLPGHSGKYWLFLALVAQEDATARPAFLAEASRYRLFPGRREGDYQHHLAEMMAADARSAPEEKISPELLEELRTKALPILRLADPLMEIRDELKRLGWGGDVRPPLTLYLAATTRLLAKRSGSMPTHTQVNGPSGTGKSYAVRCFVSLFPSEVIVQYDATSPKVMIHDAVSLKHKVLVFSEADSLPGVANGEEDNPAASMLRTLLADGDASYKIPIKDKTSGKFVIHEIKKDGPTVLITTTVNRLERQEQLDSRLFAVDIPDDPKQQEAAMAAQDQIELHDTTVEVNAGLVAFQAYLQALAPLKVVVPFVRAFSFFLRQNRIEARLLRDRARFLALLKAVTIIRHAHRQRDPQGRLVSTFEDYQTMVDLIEEMYENTTAVGPKIRELVAAVGKFPNASQTTLARHLGISQQAVSKRIKSALKGGWIRNTEHREGQPAQLRLGDPLPHRCGLPSVEQLRAWSPRQPVRREPVR